MSGYVGLIGPTKAQQELGKMLEESGNKQVIKVVTKRLFDFKHGCKVIAKMAKVDSAMAFTMLKMWRADALAKVQARSDLVPEKMMSFWKNCLLVDYRKALAKIKGKEE